MALKGLRGFRVVELTKDEDGTVEYGKEIKKLIGARSVKVVPKTSSAELYGDDQLLESNSAIGAINVEIDLAELPLELRAFLKGNTYKDGVLIENKSDTSPKIALGFVAAKSQKGDRMAWLTKGTAEPIEDESKTQTDKVDYQTQKIKFKFMPRISDGLYKITADTDLEKAPTEEEFFTTEFLKTGKKNEH
ncbi:phi13 family phage major tail protein' (plasmid) [Clostridium botulinum C/D str. BKT12695]|nr:phi13 family phage major tail protein' [Clostridium botulinum C/D str. BKT12695]